MGYGAGLLHYNKGPVYCNSVFGVTSVEQQQHKIKKDRQSTLVKTASQYSPCKSQWGL